MLRFLFICVAGLAASIAFLVAVVRVAYKTFKRTPRQIKADAPGGGGKEEKDDRPVYKTERIEKACDAVMGLVALLIPANLAIITWVYEKTHSPSYGAFLTLSTIWFLVVLFFTMYMRFNFIWGLADEIKIGVGESLMVPYWLATVMFGLSCGLFFLALSTFGIGLNIPKPSESSTPSGPVV